MTIDKLLNGIAAQFIGDSADADLTTAFGGRYFRENAVGSPAFPYVVCEVMPQATLTDSYGNVTSSDPTILFKIIGNGHNPTAANASTLLSVFDDTLLSLTGATNFSMFRVSEPIPTQLEDDQNGDQVWQWAVPYNFSIQ